MSKIPIIQTVYEVAMNNISGSRYYNRLFYPKIRAQSSRWHDRWNHKDAALILSYDIDERKDLALMPYLLKMLRKHDIKASFAAIGMLVESKPGIFNKIIDEGHEIINHTYSHPNHDEFNPNKNFHLISHQERVNEITKCHDIVKDSLGYVMKGFRVPHFGYQFTNDIYPILKSQKYIFSSSTVAVRTKTAGFPYTIKGIWELPMVCCPKHPFCIFDTSHAFRSRFARHNPQGYLDTFKSFMDDAVKDGMFINLYHDPQDIKSFDYDKLLKIIDMHKSRLLITTYDDLIKSLNKDKNNKRRL